MFQPKTHWLDNEACKVIKSFDIKNQTNFQLAPPDTHRRDMSMRNISTRKNHFVSDLSRTYKIFPIYLWYRLLDQAQIMLNMIGPSICNPHIPAHAIMEGNFDLNKTPLVPPGNNVIVNEKYIIRRTWGQQGVQSWYT